MAIVFIAFACNDNPTPTIASEPEDGNGTGQSSAKIKINPAVSFQTIESFSASDCWMPNYIGQYWSDSEKEAIAKLLFSQKIENGKPEGIGLSGWRFNLGGGTANQGAASGIEDESRRSESFMNPVDGSIDWTKQSGQQYFLEKAKGYGCVQFVMFSNTPPVCMTRNGKGYSAMGANSNLKADSYGRFAQYIADAITYFRDNKGIDFDFVSPVNEPQYNWDAPSQEGSGWQNNEIKKLTVEINSAIESKRLKTKILLAEAGNWKYLYEGLNTRENVINSLFDHTSPNYVGDLKHVAPIVAGHSYWTDGDWTTLTSVREKVKEKAAVAGLKVYQSEWSMLGDNYSTNEYIGHANATYMDIALYMSKVIHCDLTYANVSSWSYWTAVDLERWDHKNRFLLISVTPAGGVYNDIKQSGTHTGTKTLWVLGNYSLFIRPEYKRIDVAINNTSSQFFGNAFISPDKKTIVAVYTNLTKQNQDLKADLNGVEVRSIKTYTTSSNQNLEEKSITSVTSAILIQPQSVTTVVYTLK